MPSPLAAFSWGSRAPLRGEEIDIAWSAKSQLDRHLRGGSNFSDPRRNETAIPYTNNDTATLIREAVVTLTIRRAPLGLGAAGATISVLVSLAAEADSQLFDAVADAHDQGYTWDQIADRIATSDTTARRRFAAYTKWRNTRPLEPD